MTITEANGQTNESQKLPQGFVAVCELSRLQANRGVAVLLCGVPIAVFLLEDGSLHAVDNIDPLSGASVMSRGLTGEKDGEPTVASPLYKQRYSLGTGHCVEEPSVSLGVHHVQVVDGMVEIALGNGRGTS
jgi:nitrite reductase (NADH) small subunit